MEIVKKMYSGIVREYCIKNGLYTKGTNNEYSRMLNSADNATSDSDIIEVCHDIWCHSYTESYVSEGGDFCSFAYDFMKSCVHLFIEPETAEVNKTIKAKVLVYYEFDSMCHYIAGILFNKGYTANEVTQTDIINEFPDDYFNDTTETLHNEISKAFTPSEFVDVTLELLAEICEVWS